MRTGFIYAGQGSQRKGMGYDLYEKYPLYRQTLDRAAENAGFDLKKISFEDPDDELSETQFTQPCMVAFAVGVSKILEKEGIRPEMVCGLSLGEYSALYEAGVLDENEVIQLVAFRGRVMAEAAAGRYVKMAAVLQTERNVIRECCRKAALLTGGAHNVVEAANYNCPGQTVISGDAAAVDMAEALLREQGTKRIIELNVSGPFHTSLMKPAGDRLREKMKTFDFGEMKIPVIFNATGMPERTGETIRELLEKQVQSSVYLEDSVRYMAEHGIDTIVEIGPGHTLSKFVGRTAPEVKVYSIDTAEDLIRTAGLLKTEG